MLNLKIENNFCHTDCKGSRAECTAEAIVGFISLAETVSAATHSSFEHAALFIYQQGLLTKRKVEETNGRKEC